MAGFEEWAGWLKEGLFYSYRERQERHYFNVLFRDWAHFEYTWEEDVAAGGFSGPVTINDLETTKENQIWQVIFGLNKDVNMYVHLPTDIDRHGVAKRPKQTATFRNVGHYGIQDSWWYRPSFVTEHFLLKPEVPFIAFSAFNPRNIAFLEDFSPIMLNIYIAKCEMERIGTVTSGEQAPAHARFTETLDKLYRRVLRHRPLTLVPLRAPAKGV